MNNVILKDAAALAAYFDSLADDLSVRYTALTDDDKVLYVIECDGLLINPFGGDALGEKVCTLSDIPTFKHLESVSPIAASVRNGEGTKGKVITLGSAYLGTIGKYRDIAATIRNVNGI